MDLQQCPKIFCNFVQKGLAKNTYFLVRSHYLDVFEDLTDKIQYKQLRDATYEFDLLSKQLLDDCQMEEKEKAREIKKKIV